MKRSLWMLGVLVMFVAPMTTAQTTAPIFDVTPARDSVTVGDSVPLHLRLRLDERDLLLDSLPRFASEASRGIRILRTEKLVRQPDRTFAGTVVIALYRPGKRTIPPLVVTYRRNITLLGAPALSEPVDIDVVPVLPGGNSQPLQDIKELERVSSFPWGIVGAAVAAAGLALLTIRVWRRRRRQVHALPVEMHPRPRDPADVALDRLSAIEREQWPGRGEVDRHYEAVVGVLRDYLTEVARIPARESTTTELLCVMPPFLTLNGTREKLRGLLAEADLVKFARARPITAEATQFLHTARDVLRHWSADAVR